MKLDLITNKNDEFYTPIYAITPIIKYLRVGSKVWCPFDTEESNFVKVLKQKGFDVAFSHISKGGDFFELLPPEGVDYIISNPPYSIKAEVFERLFSFNVPFAMLVGVVGLFESKRRFNLFSQNKIEILYFNRRVSYFKNYADQKPSLNPPFSSVYLCSNILPSQILFETIN